MSPVSPAPIASEDDRWVNSSARAGQPALRFDIPSLLPFQVASDAEGVAPAPCGDVVRSSAAEWKDVFAFAILIVVLILRPSGLLGERTAEKV